MMIRRFAFLFYLVYLHQPFLAGSQALSPDVHIREYVERYKDIAVRKMTDYGIPASITLAQGILESSCGKSKLALQANNHFGIKCHKDWQGDTFIQDDDSKDECFRKYGSPEESFEDHSLFLSSRDRYASLFQLDPTDYKGWAHGLQKAGYATNPGYARHLIRLIEENRLFEWDRPPGQQSSASRRKTQALEKKSRDKDKEDFKDIVIQRSSRKVLFRNRVKYVNAKDGDTPETLAREMELSPWQICRYNDKAKGEAFSPGEPVYLQPKRRKSEKDFHVLEEGETLETVSRDYAVKLGRLYKMNRLAPGDTPEPGSKIWMRKKKPSEGVR